MQTDNTLKYIIYTLLGLIFMVPFIVDGTQLFPFITGKAFFFRFLAEAIFFVWLILAVRNPEYRPRFSWILASVTAFVLMIGISNVFGANPFTSFWSNYERMEGYVNILHLFAMFLAVGSVIKTREDWNKVLITSFVMSIGMIYTAFVQYFKSDNPIIFRLDANFGNPIYLAVYCLLHIFLGLYLISAKSFLKRAWQRITISIFVILHLFILYQTITRGAILGLIGGLFVIGILNIITTRKENRKLWLVSVVSVSTLIILIGAFLFVKDSQFVKSNIVLSRFAEISLTSGTSEARLLNWSIAIEGFKEKPILGWGMGNYSYVFDKYYKPAMWGNESWFDHVHNIVLDWLIAGGIVGLLLYLIVLVTLVLAIWLNKNYSYTEKNIFIGLVAGYFIQNLFVFDNQTSYIYFFLLLAMFHSVQNREISIFKKQISHNVIYLLSLIIWILLPVTIYYVNASGYFASRNVINTIRGLGAMNQVSAAQAPNYVKQIINNIKKTAELNSFASLEVRTKGVVEPAFTFAQMPAQNLSDQEKQTYIQFASDQMSAELQNNPNDSKTNYLMGIYLAQFGQHKNAENFFQKAVELSPNKQIIILSQATNNLRLGNKERAIELAKRAYESAEGDSEFGAKYDSLWVEYMKIVVSANPELSTKLIEEEMKAGRNNRVEMLLRKSVDSGSKNYQSYISLAAFYLQQGNKQKSLDTLNLAKEKFPDLSAQISKLISDIEAGKNPVGQKF